VSRTLYYRLCLTALLAGTLPGCAKDVSGYYACLSAPRDRSIPIVAEALPPKRPYRAIKNDTVGWVELEVTVGRDGHVDHAEVIAADPPDVFDRAAVRGALAWRYCPLPDDAPDYPGPIRRKVSFGHD